MSAIGSNLALANMTTMHNMQTPTLHEGCGLQHNLRVPLRS